MVKIGILGLGSIGRRHEANFKSLGCEVVGYDPAVTSFDKFDEVFDCDGIVVASPSSEHFKQISYAHKPLFVEKPLVMTQEEWNSVPLHNVRMVGYNLRFHSCVQEARGWMGIGLIGKPLWARFTCAQYNNRPAYLRDGVILNWSHEIDLAIHLLGGADVLGAAASATSEDCADVLLLHHRNKCHTTIHLDYLTRPERRGFVIVGDKGAIECDLVNRQVFRRGEDGKIADAFVGIDNWDTNYLYEAKTFLRVLEYKATPDECFFCTAREAHDVVGICLKAKEFASEQA